MDPTNEVDHAALLLFMFASTSFYFPFLLLLFMANLILC